MLSTIYASAVAGYLTSHSQVRGVAPAAQVHGDTKAFWWSAGFFAVGALLALVILPGKARARSASVTTALARHAIGNCHHDEPETEVAVAGGPSLVA